MKLFIGLGNPGNEYAKTRHNAGFLIIDEIKRQLGFPEFTFEKKFNAEISEANMQGEKILLIKPQTFMNLSGQSVQAIMNFYKLTPENIIVIHDDLDIDFGAFKISTNSSAGGHNGIIDIIEKIGTQKFKRVRIGIEGAEAKLKRVMSGKDFVMQNFSQEELETLGKLAKEITGQL